MYAKPFLVIALSVCCIKKKEDQQTSVPKIIVETPSILNSVETVLLSSSIKSGYLHF